MDTVFKFLASGFHHFSLLSQYVFCLSLVMILDCTAVLFILFMQFPLDAYINHLIFFLSIAGKSNLEKADLEPALKALKDKLMTKNVVCFFTQPLLLAF